MKGNYLRLLVTLTISFIIMYGVMFLNVSRADHIYLSLTRVYMTLLMVAPMAILMIAMMGMMYRDKKKNALVIFCSIAVFALALTFLRKQTFISEEQYMKAMIPHHSSAILTSTRASLTDPEVKELAGQIIRSQEDEIAQMKQMLERMENKDQ